MAYDLLATSATPALVIYLLDVSASMSQTMGTGNRLDIVLGALDAAIQQMVFRSTRGARVSSRYRVAMFAYSDHVYDLLDGIRSVDTVAQMGLPPLEPLRTTRTAAAFEVAEKLLRAELPNLRNCPAPLVCHMTDGEYNGDDPEPVVRRIMSMAVDDGGVLVENIFIAPNVLTQAVQDPHTWGGVLPSTALASDYARKLRAMSSPVPQTYLETMLDNNYNLAQGAVMLFPGSSPDLVAMGFQMSAATPIR